MLSREHGKERIEVMRKVVTPTNSITRREFLGGAAGIIAVPWLGLGAASSQVVPEPAERQKIEAAIPAKAIAPPRKARKLLIFDLNVGYGGHRSISTCNLAFTMMGEKTGVFQTVISRDPSIFKAENLSQFDAVFLNNTVGNLFEDPALRQNLIEFVYGGGGLMGVHGTSVAFTKWPGAIEDWPEFGVCLGARGANHRASDEHVFIKLDDVAHPVNQAFAGQGFDYRDEFFRVHEPYSRNRVRVLLSIDTEKTDMQQGPAYGKLERAGQRLRTVVGAAIWSRPRLLLHDRAQSLRLLGSEDVAVLPGGCSVRPGRPAGADNSKRQIDAGYPVAGAVRLAAGAHAAYFWNYSGQHHTFRGYRQNG